MVMWDLIKQFDESMFQLGCFCFNYPPLKQNQLVRSISWLYWWNRYSLSWMTSYHFRGILSRSWGWCIYIQDPSIIHFPTCSMYSLFTYIHLGSFVGKCRHCKYIIHRASGFQISRKDMWCVSSFLIATHSCVRHPQKIWCCLSVQMNKNQPKLSYHIFQANMW